MKDSPLDPYRTTLVKRTIEVVECTHCGRRWEKGLDPGYPETCPDCNRDNQPLKYIGGSGKFRMRFDAPSTKEKK